MDVGRRNAITIWINCLQVGPEIGDLRELHDGRHFISLLKIMNPESKKDKFILKNWSTIVRHFLEEHYDVGLKDDLNFAAAERKNELELAKIAILLLCASVHCNGKEQFIKAICKLESTVQELIKSIIEGVLSPSGTTLCHDFVKVLKVTDSSVTANCADVPCTRIQQEKPHDCTVYCDDVEDAYSPIKQCFQTPQVASWSVIKEKEFEIHKLKGELEAERTSQEYLESDVENLKKENGQLLASIEALKKTTRDLTEKCNSLNECHSLLAKTELALKKLHVRCDEQAQVVSDYPSLEMAFKNQRKEISSLEESLDQLQKQLKASEQRVTEMISMEDTVAELNAVLLSKENDLKCLKAMTKDQEDELKELRQMNKEMSGLIENKSKCQDLKSGENMAVISDIIALENDIKRLHEEALTKEKQMERLMKTHSETCSQLELELRNANLKVQRTEEDIRSFQADVQLLRDQISKLDDKLVSVQEMRTKEQCELKAIINQMKDDIQFQHQQLNDKNDLIKVLEMHEAEMDKKYSTLSEEKQSLVAENASLVDRFTNLSQDLHSKCLELSSLRETASSLKEEVNKCVKESEVKSSRINQLMTIGVQHDATIKKQKEDIEVLHKELNDKADRIKMLEVHESEMEKKYNALSEEKESLEAENASIEDKFTSLFQDFHSKDTELSSLREIASALEEEVNKCVKESEAKSLNIDQLMAIEVEHNAMIKQQKGDMEVLRKELQDKTDRIKALEMHESEMDMKYNALAEEKENIVSENASLEDRFTSLTQDFNLKCTELSTLREMASTLEGKVKKCIKESEAKGSHIDQLMAIDDEHNAVIKQQKEDIEVMHKELQDKTDRIKFLEMQESEMNKKYNVLNEEKQSLVAEKATMEAKFESLSHDFHSKDTELSSLQETALALEEEVKKGVKEAKANSSRIDQLIAKDAELNAIIKQQKEDNEFLNKELNDKNDHIKELELRESVMGDKYNALVEEKENLVAENALLENRFTSLSGDCLSKDTELSSLRDSASALEQEVMNCVKESEEKSLRIDQLMAMNVEITAKYEELVKEKVALVSEASSNREKLERLRSLESQNTSRQQHHEDMLRKSMALTTENGDLKIEVQQLKNKLDRQNDFFSKQKEFTEQVAAMKSQIQEAEKRHCSIIRSLQEEKQSLTDKYEKAKDMLKELSDQLRVRDEEFENCNSQLESFRNHYQTSQENQTSLTTENVDLKTEIQQLKSKLDSQKDFFSKQKECTDQIATMQAQIQDAEIRHYNIIRSLKAEKQSLTDKYEKAKDVINEMSDQLRVKDEELEKFNSQLESFREHYQASRESLTKVMSLHKNADHEKNLLEDRLHKESEKSAQQAAHIKKLEMLLDQLQKRGYRHSSSDNIFLKPPQVEHQTRHPRRPSITVTYNSAESYNLMFDEDQLHKSTLSINAAPQDIKVENTFAVPRVIVPPGASNYFPCEDEEGELLNFSYLVGQNADHNDMPSKNVFVQPPRSLTSSSRQADEADVAFSNLSYLNDLKSGRCELPHESERLSELQRRNTLCLPHLKTSYPVEMQSQTMMSYTDEDFKTGKLDITGLSQISAINGDHHADLSCDTFGAKKKFTKPIQPTYQKPGPPTPGKSSKAGAGPNKPSKTPMSLKRLLHRTHLRTPKGTSKGKVTPKKNRENQPPEPNQGPRPRRNLAFTIGLSPKVKSHPKSLAISKKTSTPKK